MTSTAFKCQDCTKSYATSPGLSQHRSRYHPKDKTLLLCKFCGKPFPSTSSAREHESDYCPMNPSRRSPKKRVREADPTEAIVVNEDPLVHSLMTKLLSGVADNAEIGVNSNSHSSNSILYKQLGWHLVNEIYTEDDKLLSTFTIISSNRIDEDGEEEEDLIFFNSIRRLYQVSLSEVGKFDISFRNRVGGTKVLIPLHPQSQDKYSRIIAQFVLFVTRSIDLIPATDELKEATRNLMEDPTNRVNLFHFLLLLIQESPSSSNSHDTYITKFLYYITKDDTTNELMKADQMTQICSKFKYMIKLTILESTRELTGVELNNRFKELLSLIKIDDDLCIFSQISTIKRLAEIESMSCDKIPNVFQTAIAGEKIVKNVLVKLDQIKAGIQALIAKINEDILFLKLGAPNLDINVKNINDDMSNSSDGYGFLVSDDDNDYTTQSNIKVRSKLLTYLKHNDEMKSNFFSRFNPNQVNESEAKTWLERYDLLQEELLTLIHLTSGMVARATELAEYTIINPTSNSLRTLFISQGICTFIPHYNKTNNLLQRNKLIARFLNSTISKLVLDDLVYLRPLAIFFYHKIETIDDEEKQLINDVYRKYLFVKKGSRMTADNIRSIFSKNINIFCGIIITFGNYRQLAASYALDVNLRDLVIGIDEENDNDYDSDNFIGNSSTTIDISTVAHQQGSSVITSLRHYGRSNLEHTLIRNVILNQYRELSRKWHVFLGLEIIIQQPQQQQQQKLSLSPIKSSLNNTNNNNYNNNINDQNIINNNYSIVLSNPSSSFSSYSSSSSSNSFFSSNLFPQLTTYVDFSAITNTQSTQCLNLLREFFKDETVDFKSNEQRLACEKTIYSKSDLIIILPTGLGKSLTFFLYAKAFPNQSIIVIVPLTSLRDDLVRRGREFGFSCTDSLININNSYNNVNNNSIHYNLIFITTDHALLSSSSETISHLHCRKMLGPLFIDECHLISLQKNFRTNFLNISRINPLGIKMIALSGTVKDFTINDIKEIIFHNRPVEIIRQATQRTNIGYNVYKSNSFPDMKNNFLNLMNSEFNKLGPKDKIIIFVPFIKDIDILSLLLNHYPTFTNFVTYYANLDDQTKTDNMRKWMNDDDTKIIIASSAFGLGLDFPSVRIVICFGLPYTIEDFIQQTGRASRDGKKAMTYLFYNNNEYQSRSLFIDKNENNISSNLNDLRTLFTFAQITTVCRRRLISNYFNETEVSCSYSFQNQNCVQCDNCHPTFIPSTISHDNFNDIIQFNNESSTIINDESNSSNNNTTTTTTTTICTSSTPISPFRINQGHSISPITSTAVSNYYTSVSFISPGSKSSLNNTFMMPNQREVAKHHQQAIQSYDQLFSDNLIDQLLKFDKRCIVCYLYEDRKKTSNHPTRECPITKKNRCFVCLNIGHKGSNCLYKNTNPLKICCYCYLPNELYNTKFHKGPFEKGAENCLTKSNILKYFAITKFCDDSDDGPKKLNELLKPIPQSPNILRVYQEFCDFMKDDNSI